MARYRKVSILIWNDEKFRKLSDDSKLLFIFLLTHPHMTSIGGMRATQAGIGSELGWDARRTSKAFAEPLAKGMAWIDESASCLILPNFIKHNPPENPNVITSWIAMFEQIPECEIRTRLFQRISEYGSTLEDKMRKAFERVAECLSAPVATPEPFPFPEPLPEPEPPSEPHGGEAAFRVTPELVIQTYNENRGPLPEATVLSAGRRKKCLTRISKAPDPKEYLAAFERGVAKASRSLFCTGHGDRGWFADFDFMIDNEENLLRILEGKFDNKPKNNGHYAGKIERLPQGPHAPHRCTYCQDPHEWICDEPDVCNMKLEIACPTAAARYNH